MKYGFDCSVDGMQDEGHMSREGCLGRVEKWMEHHGVNRKR